MVEFDVKGKELICSFSGRLDTVSCMKWEDELRGKVQESKVPVIFDLQGVDYIASSFLRICLRAAKEVKSEEFSLINVSPSVKKVFKIAGFDRQLTIK